MPKFEVRLNRRIVEVVDVLVEAEDSREAEWQALKDAEETEPIEVTQLRQASWEVAAVSKKEEA